MRISIPQIARRRSQLRVTRMQNDISDKLAAIPGVTSVGFASEMPMEGVEPSWDVIVPEGKPSATDRKSAAPHV